MTFQLDVILRVLGLRTRAAIGIAAALAAGCGQILGIEPGQDGPLAPIDGATESDAPAPDGADGETEFELVTDGAAPDAIATMSAAEFCSITRNRVPGSLLSPDFASFTNDQWAIWAYDAKLAKNVPFVPTFHEGTPSFVEFATGLPAEDIQAQVIFDQPAAVDSFEMTLCMQGVELYDPASSVVYVNWAGSAGFSNKYNLSAWTDHWALGRWSATADDILHGLVVPSAAPTVGSWVGIRVRHELGTTPRVWVGDFSGPGFARTDDAKPFERGSLGFGIRRARARVANVVVLPL